MSDRNSQRNSPAARSAKSHATHLTQHYTGGHQMMISGDAPVELKVKVAGEMNLQVMDPLPEWLKSPTKFNYASPQPNIDLSQS